MENTNYNGWTNYATWRVNLEVFDGIEFDNKVTTNELREIVEECVFRNPDTCNTPYLVEDYARAFLNEVNYYEIAEHINDNL